MGSTTSCLELQRGETEVSEEITDFNTYYGQVGAAAIDLGYTVQQVRIFYNDILDYYHEGKSVEECINEVF